MQTNVFLPDSLFPFKNVKTTFVPDNSRIKYHELDSTEKMKLLVPVLFNGSNHASEIDYLIHWQIARFISIQRKIENFTPIIVSVSGDDYDATFYIVVNDFNTPISALQISGSGICAGPDEISDSLLLICDIRNSLMKDKTIDTYILKTKIQPDSIKHPDIIDSISYCSTILSNGFIETKLKDSTRYKRFTN